MRTLCFGSSMSVALLKFPVSEVENKLLIIKAIKNDPQEKYVEGLGIDFGGRVLASMYLLIVCFGVTILLLTERPFFLPSFLIEVLLLGPARNHRATPFSPPHTYLCFSFILPGFSHQ